MGAVIMVNVAAVFSTLGNPNSLIPLLVKDTAATAGMTTGSMLTGKEEGQDRLIDEVGTEIIWLCAIPAFKWLFDKTIFKYFGLDSKFDVRNLKNKDIFEKTKELAPTEEIKKNLDKIAKKQGVFKNLALYKFFFSTGMAILSYIGLTRAKQHYTENKIKKNLIVEFNAKKEKEEQEKNNNATKSNSGGVTFKGVGDVVKYFAFSPVRNMWVLDGAITTERLADSRTPQEFVGYGIKEASTLCFMYYAGGKIQDYMEKRAMKKHNRTIGMDARIIENGNLQKSFENNSVKKSLADFKNIMDAYELEKKNTTLTLAKSYKEAQQALKEKYDVKIYEFIHKNPDNDIVKAAKESNIISLLEKPKQWYQIFKKAEKTDKIDTRKYIDLEDIKNLYKNVDTLYNQYLEALKKGDTTEKFFKQVKKLKRHSILTNIGTCMFALGIVTPAIMLAKRLVSKDDAEFQTKKEIRQKLIEEGII